MTTQRVVYLEGDALRATLRRPDFAHHWQEYAVTAPHEVAPRLREATIAIVNKVRLDATVFDQLPALCHVAVAATGVNNVDLDAARAHGVTVTNIRGYATETVPEHALSLMMALSRNLFAYRADVAAGRWQRAPNFCFFDHPVRDLSGQTLTLIGRGDLGQGTARLAEALRMHVQFAEHPGEVSVRKGYVPFDDALSTADIVSLHCPLNEATQHLIGERELRLMKDDALLINTARGGLVDEEALARALRKGWIGGAGFDVLSAEPPREGNPLLAEDLLARPNFLLTPHIAWASEAAMQRLADQLIDNLERAMAGDVRNRVA